MKKYVKQIGVILMITSLFISKVASAQLPGSLIPLIIVKKATGYWDDNNSTEIVANNPDSDGDGLIDSIDDCPYLKGKKENNGCPLSKTEMIVIYDVSEKVFFETGSAKLDAKSHKDLDKLAEVLKNNPEVSIEIEGHTDNTGTKEINKKLSKERAVAVKKYLETKAGPLNNVSISAQNSEEPIATNKTKRGRSKNRRSEIDIRLVEIVK